jgi:Domain of unknown function (DUF1963)
VFARVTHDRTSGHAGCASGSAAASTARVGRPGLGGTCRRTRELPDKSVAVELDNIPHTRTGQMTNALPSCREALRQSLAAAGFGGRTLDRLAEQARTAVCLITESVDDARIVVGVSKIGGCPDLPRALAWPSRPAYPHSVDLARDHERQAQLMINQAAEPGCWMTPDQAAEFAGELRAKASAVARGFPLAFIAQLDLVELANEPGFDRRLPDIGRLLFFFDYWTCPGEWLPGSHVGWRLIWDTTPAAELERKPPPAELSSLSSDTCTTVFDSARIAPHSVVTPIPIDAAAFDGFGCDDQDAVPRYATWFGQLGQADRHHDATHRLGAWPTPLPTAGKAVHNWRRTVSIAALQARLQDARSHRLAQGQG